MSELLLQWIEIHGRKHGVSQEVAAAFNNLQAELREAQRLARLYLFIAGPALGGTDHVEELAKQFPNPYDAFNEAERRRKEEGDKLIEIFVSGWKQRAETAERLLQEREDTIDEIERMTGFDWERDQLPIAEHVRRTIQMREMQMAGLVGALNIIASWEEGAAVNPSFDEPASATTARNALTNLPNVSKYRRLMKALDEMERVENADVHTWQMKISDAREEVREAFRAIKP